MADELRPDDVRSVVVLTGDLPNPSIRPDAVKGGAVITRATPTEEEALRPDSVKSVALLTAVPAAAGETQAIRPDSIKAVVIVVAGTAAGWREPPIQGERLRRRTNIQGTAFKRKPGQMP